MPPEKPTHPSIECAKNGPDRVRNVETFANSQGRVIKPGELDDALAKAIAHPGPSLVEVVSDPELI